LEGKLNKQNRLGEDALESLWDSIGGRLFYSQGRLYSEATLDYKKTLARIPTTSASRSASPAYSWATLQTAKGSKETVKMLFLVCFVI